MREKHSSPRKMVAAMPTVVPCVSPKQGSVYPGNHHHQHHQNRNHHHQQDNRNHRQNNNNNNNNSDRQRNLQQDGGGDDGDSADDNMMPFDLSRNGSSPSSSPRSSHRSQRMSPVAFKPYNGSVTTDDQPLDLRVDRKKSRRGDELEDENQNLIIRTPSPEDIEVDSPGPPAIVPHPYHQSHHHHHHVPLHHDRNRGHVASHSPCSSEKDVVVADEHHDHSSLQRRGGVTVDEEQRHHHRMVNYPVLFPPQPLHPMMLEAIYRAGGGGDKSRLPPSLAGYQPAGGFHRPSQHYPFINPSLLNGHHHHHHHVPPPTYDVVRPPPPPPPPVARSPQQKSSSFQETTGKPKDR